MKLQRIIVGLACALSLGLGAGCKQGEGDRCEVEWDCEDGLQCCTGSETCQQTCTSGQRDATVSHDASGV